MGTTNVTQHGEGDGSKPYAGTKLNMLAYLVLNSNNMGR